MYARSVVTAGAILASVILCVIAYLPRLPAAMLAKLPKSVSCKANSEPAWFDSVLQMAKELAYPGFQIAYRNGATRHTCSAGWTHSKGLITPLRRDHRFRLASLSKIMTSVVVRQLIEEGKLAPSDRAVSILGIVPPYEDQRIADISIQQLLRHRAGFDRRQSSDPMTSTNPWCPNQLSRIKSARLDFLPGYRFAYSNLGYCLLGAVIAQVESTDTEQSIHTRVLGPIPDADIRPVRNGRLDDKEAGYFFDDGDSSYGLLRLDYASMVATGGWSGTADDMLALLESISAQIISIDKRRLETTAGSPDGDCEESVWRGCHEDTFYRYKENSGPVMYWRDGSLPGISAFAAYFDDGTVISFLANSRSFDWMPRNDKLGKMIYKLFAGLSPRS